MEVKISLGQSKRRDDSEEIDYANIIAQDKADAIEHCRGMLIDCEDE